MSKVLFDISTSLDGFITASGRRPEEPISCQSHTCAFI